MNAITKFALENNPIKIDALITVLESLKEQGSDIDRIAAVLLGLEPIYPKLPKEASIYEEKNIARMVSYDMISDEVSFEYDDLATLYFKNELEAEKYAAGESYYNYDYAFRAKEDYQFPGVRSIVSHGSVSRAEWLEKAVK